MKDVVIMHLSWLRHLGVGAPPHGQRGDCHEESGDNHGISVSVPVVCRVQEHKQGSGWTPADNAGPLEERRRG